MGGIGRGGSLMLEEETEDFIALEEEGVPLGEKGDGCWMRRRMDLAGDGENG